jgi:dihydroneopterin aldolase
MNLEPVIAEIVDELSDFLDGTTDREEARTRIADRLENDFFHLPSTTRLAVIEAVMAHLEEVEHFDVEYVGNPFKDESEPDEGARA